ncbi:hypothetical protein RFI_03277 [Reticulomyxa filosa]|uniref:Kelch motif family protein n=1 Tax=Reticulomyxa filosa TaxID=46433 RepID=X6P6M2_RETFI|nr:hypothetical protein RFI_03277 [Reticulomyxa filosa]|eukprot:ETO33826.1 hypothetical protein RFI_03277 [Reticulomyxa filosa]
MRKSFPFFDDFILFFGGQNYDGFCISNDVYKYSIVDKKWMKFDLITVLNESDMFIHIIGGYNGNSGYCTNHYFQLCYPDATLHFFLKIVTLYPKKKYCKNMYDKIERFQTRRNVFEKINQFCFIHMIYHSFVKYKIETETHQFRHVFIEEKNLKYNKLS